MSQLIGRGHCRTCPIRPSSLFGCLDESELHLIEDFQTRVMTYAKGEVVYHEGEKLGRIFTLREGIIKLTRFNSEGNAQIVRLVKPGDLFGFERLISDASYQHTAEAISPIEICQLSIEKLTALRNQSTDINHAITERALLQVMKTEEHLTQIGLLKSKARLAWFLLNWTNHTDDPTPMPLSRRELGQYLGLTIETVSRHLAEWKRTGTLNENSGIIELANVEELEEIAEG